MEEAYSGEEGVIKAEKKHYDIILVDFKMPGMNGEEVLDKIKSFKPDCPIILFSVYHDDSTTITSEIRKKADGIISKPFSGEHLIDTINNVLEEKRAAM